MKFTKGLAMGALITAGAMMMASEETKRKMMKKGRQMVKKMKVTL